MRISLYKRLWGILLVLLVVMFAGINVHSVSKKVDTTSTNSTTEQSKVATGNNIQELPKPLIGAIANSLGRDNASYHVTKTASGSYKATTPAHKFSTTFTKDGITVRRLGVDSDPWQWEMTLTGIGYEDKISPVVSVRPIGSSNRIEYRRNKITEWYLNSQLGLEQGFTLSAPPVSKTEGKALVLEFETRGELMPAVRGNRKEIEWKMGSNLLLTSYSLNCLYYFENKDFSLGSK